MVLKTVSLEMTLPCYSKQRYSADSSSRSNSVSGNVQGNPKQILTV